MTGNKETQGRDTSSETQGRDRGKHLNAILHALNVNGGIIRIDFGFKSEQIKFIKKIII